MPVFFRLRFSDYLFAMRIIWKRQEAASQPLTSSNVSAVGEDTSVSFTTPENETLFRNVLKELNIQFTESNQPQVRSWLDSVFG